MSSKGCSSPCFALHVLLSLLTHLAELVLSALLAYTLYADVIYRDVFFALTAGFLIIPLVTQQLVSAIFLLRRRGDLMGGGEAAVMAGLHVTQLGFVWRHLSLLQATPRRDPHGNKRKDLSELFVLRLIFTFAGGFPLVLVQLYLVLTKAALARPWVLYASLLATVMSTTYAVASYRRSSEETLGGGGGGRGRRRGDGDNDDEDSSSGGSVALLSWPGSLFRLLWRAGEIVARVISLALFATLYKEWLFLVLGFHWVIMIICISIPQTASSAAAAAGGGGGVVGGGRGSSSKIGRAAFCAVTSYCYIFCYVNVSRVRTAVWYTLYYVIMFLENGTLSIVWLTKSEKDTFTSRYLLVFVSTLAFFAAMVCLAVYYKYFHVTSDDHPDLSKSPGGCLAKGGTGGCLNCHRRVCTHHPTLNPQQRTPYPAGWMSQYHTALTAGQYYKHAMHDSLLDSASASDLASLTTTAGGPAGRQRLLQQRLALLDSSDPAAAAAARAGLTGGGGRGGGCPCAGGGADDAVSMVSCVTCRSAVSCPHSGHGGGSGGGGGRRCCSHKASRSDLTDTTSVLTFASGASHNLGYEGSDESQFNAVPAWLPAGESLIAKHLMAPESLHGGTTSGTESDKAMEHYRHLLKQEAQRWGSSANNNHTAGTDGYSTDHTVMEWSKLPVTVLANNVWAISDPDSDHTTQYHQQHQQQHQRCCRCITELSPGDSEVSSIFKASETTHLDSCDNCCGGGGGGGNDGGDVVYGVPGPRAARFPQRQGHHSRKHTSSASDSEGACPCCSHHQHQHVYHHQQHHNQQQQQQQQQQHQQKRVKSGDKKSQSQPNVFVISHKDGRGGGGGGSRGGGGGDDDGDSDVDHHHHQQQHEDCGHYDAKRSVSDSEGVLSARGRKQQHHPHLHHHAGVFKKSSKHSAMKLKQRDHSGGGGSRSLAGDGDGGGGRDQSGDDRGSRPSEESSSEPRSARDHSSSGGSGGPVRDHSSSGSGGGGRSARDGSNSSGGRSAARDHSGSAARDHSGSAARDHSGSAARDHSGPARDHSGSPRDHSSGRSVKDHSQHKSPRDRSEAAVDHDEPSARGHAGSSGDHGKSARDHNREGRSTRNPREGGKSKSGQGTSTERSVLTTPRDAESSSASKSDLDSHRSEESSTHVPSKLQVKAIAEKSDEESSPKHKPTLSSSSSRGSEPVYANISAFIQQQNQSNSKSSSNNPKPTSNTNNGSPRNVIENKDNKNLTVEVELHSKAFDEKQSYQNEDELSLDSEKPGVNRDLKKSTERLHLDNDNEEKLLRNKTNNKDVCNKDDCNRDHCNKDHCKIDHCNKDHSNKDYRTPDPLSKGDKCSRRRGEGVPRAMTEKRGGKSSSSSSRSSRAGIRSSAGRQEPWYVCSESEDSALPAETFSSSVDDGFTATDLDDLDDSDGSVELII